jgi:ribosome-binding protein aMBF1 (putative translation factor)
MAKVRDLHRKWMKEAGYRKAYASLDEEYELARLMIEARARAGLTQAELAKRMRTSQSVVARLEGGRAKPSMTTLRRFARATGSRLTIAFR